MRIVLGFLKQKQWLNLNQQPPKIATSVHDNHALALILHLMDYQPTLLHISPDGQNNFSYLSV